MKYLLAIVGGVVVGCGGPHFTNLGNGVAVPRESIERYAIEHGVTRAEARAQLRVESDQRRSQPQAANVAPNTTAGNRNIEPTDAGAPAH